MVTHGCLTLVYNHHQQHCCEVFKTYGTQGLFHIHMLEAQKTSLTHSC